MSSIQPTTLDTPLSSPTNITKLLTLWFDTSHGLTEGLKKWFLPSPAVDAELIPWKPLVEAAFFADDLSSWTLIPDGTLALLLLLDQLPRNIFRGTSRAYASSEKALSIALDAIARGVDRQVPLERQMFFYLPLTHHEDSSLGSKYHPIMGVCCLSRTKGDRLRLEDIATSLLSLGEGTLTARG